MKKNLALLCLAFVLALPFISFTTGCQHLPSGQVVINTNLIDRTAAILRAATADGLTLALETDTNSVNTVAYLRVASSVLDKLLAGGDLSPATVRTALTALPVKELKSPVAKAVITTALASYEIYFGDYVRGKIGANYAAITLIAAVRDGIATALPAP